MMPAFLSKTTNKENWPTLGDERNQGINGEGDEARRDDIFLAGILAE